MNKRKRGRPIGGKAPPEVRAYWRTRKRDLRAAKKIASIITGKKREK